MLTVHRRHAVHPGHAKTMDTDALHARFLAREMFAAGEIRLLYTHCDRFVLGGAVLADGGLVLDHVAETRGPGFLDRREMGIVNIGAPCRSSAGGQSCQLATGDVLYLGMGSGPVTFAGDGRFYITSAPAHRALPVRLITNAECIETRLGAAETSNRRTIKQFIHPKMMGQPQETRHLFVADEQAALSPPRSIHSGAGIGAYSFIWAMAGDNVDHTEMDSIQPQEMR